MLFHTQFVLAALTNLQLQWKSPPREDAETTWGEAARRHGLPTLLGLGWGVAVYWLAPSYIWWLMPIVGALVLAIPISVLSSRVALGRALRRAGFFVIPEETDPPAELRTVGAVMAAAGRRPGFVDAVVDPEISAVSCAALPRLAGCSDRASARRSRTIATATAQGPSALSDRDKRLVLTNPGVLCQLHQQVSTSPAAHPDWQTAAALRPPVNAPPPPVELLGSVRQA
jgi:membrane glycosyltransferase